MEDIKEQIRNCLQKAVREITGEDSAIYLEPPLNIGFGDYTSNIALQLQKKVLKKKYHLPLQLAEEIQIRLQRQNNPYIDKIDVIQPGFINIFVSKTSLITNLIILLGSKKNTVKSRKTNEMIMLEFADPNPFKQFHIGHLRNIVLGESYARLYESQGATVWRVNYQGDVGMHVAKAIWGMRNLSGQMPSETASLTEKASFLGKSYAIGAKAYEENEKDKTQIRLINTLVYKKDKEVMGLWELGRGWSLNYFEEIYKRLSTRYKRYYFESEVAAMGKDIVLNNIVNHVFEESEGAVIFRGEKQGLHTRVFLAKEGYATYEAKDLALASIKYNDFRYTKSIIITAHEQSEYFKVVLQAMKKVFPELASKTVHISFGFVSLKDGKMSSRSGNIISGQWLLDESKKRLKKLFPEMEEETLEQVAVGSIKYSMLKFSRESDIAFSFEESISLEGNSGPYIQYAFVRSVSVVRKASRYSQNDQFYKELKKYSEELILGEEERIILRKMIHFSQVVKISTDLFAPNLLCNYLTELASTFNHFYQTCKIVNGTNELLRVAITASVSQILEKGLFLLGIEAPLSM